MTNGVLSKPRPVAGRADVLAILQREEPAVRKYFATALYVYGSAARDELAPNSDIDLFIDYDRAGPFSFVELIRLEQLLEDLLGRPVDLATRDGLHALLKDDIERSSIRVF